MKKCLLDLTDAELKDEILALNDKAFRVKQIKDAVLRMKEFGAMNLPENLISGLSFKYDDVPLKIVKTLKSRDGTKKYLYALNDNNIIEGVYMPHNYGNTLCVSTQVGCKMACAFCASGIGGLVRNLTAAEMLGQVYAANIDNGGTPKNRAVTNVVLMGSGEPLDNYENVVEFIKRLSAEDGLNVSQRNISLSTVGIPENIRRLADDGLSVTLTVSLHAPTDDKRKKLIPMTNKYGIKEVTDAAKYYFEKTGRRVIFEYAAVSGINTDEQSANELAVVIKGFPSHLNIIKLNYVKEKGLKPASDSDIDNFVKCLENLKVSVTVRRSMGKDVDGACGQLRRKHIGGELE